MFFYTYLREQIPILILLSLVPGFFYIALGGYNRIITPALIWYFIVLLLSLWGFTLYKSFDENRMSKAEKLKWYKALRYFFYLYFFAWMIIFLVYVSYPSSNMHYIAIFTEIGASVVASALLFADRKLFIPIIMLLMLPLVFIFILHGALFSYVLALFTLILTWVLYYFAQSSHTLLHKTATQANEDMLTALYNRRYSEQLLQESINALKDQTLNSYIILIDLDHFKTINDTLGHDIGDLLLIEVSKRMQKLCHSRHAIARLGGDEFIIILQEPISSHDAIADAKTCAYKLLDTIKEAYSIKGHQLFISASMGISIISDPNKNAHSYIKEADIAMYEVKSRGKDGVFIFDTQTSIDIERRLAIENELPLAIENGEFHLHFQPQINKEGTVIGCETLVRWDSKRFGSVSPAEFIPLAEQTTHIIKLETLILTQAFQTLAAWHKEGITLQNFAINLSTKYIFHYDFIPLIKALGDRYLNEKLKKCVVFEITESIEADDIYRLNHMIQALKSEHYRFSLDDFGTGYSSLSYLNSIPIDEIKVDKSFIQSMHEHKSKETMVDTIISLAKKLNLTIVAEGVETQEQLEYLKKRECDIIQGYFYSEPIEEQAFKRFYTQHNPRN